ncbi:TPA: DNA primase, partial [Escherichia coli]|nr:DNA primase [Escherichia coli]
PRTSLYRLYLAFMEYMGKGEKLSVNDFGKAMKLAAREYGAEYMTRGFKGRTQTNVIRTERTEEFL